MTVRSDASQTRGRAAVLAEADPIHAAPAIAQAFADTFWIPVALIAAALIPALLLPRQVRQ